MKGEDKKLKKVMKDFWKLSDKYSSDKETFYYGVLHIIVDDLGKNNLIKLIQDGIEERPK